MNPQAVVSTQYGHPIPPLPQKIQLFMLTQTLVLCSPPFNIPLKLHAVEEVMRRLAIDIAKEAIFGKKELKNLSLSGKREKAILTKINFITL